MRTGSGSTGRKRMARRDSAPAAPSLTLRAPPDGPTTRRRNPATTMSRLTPRRDGRTSPVASVLLVLGGVFLVIALACGGVLYVGYRKAQQFKEEMAER